MRTIRSVAFVLFLVPLAVLAVGCGSGGKTDSQSEIVYALSSQTRALQTGDSWTYDNGDRVTISPSTLDGVPIATQVFGYAAGDGGFGYTVKYFTQNDARDVAYVGRRGENSTARLPDDPAREVQKLPAPQTVLFGNWVQGAKLSFTLRYASDAIYSPAGEDATLTIVGTEKVKIPLGTFDTWKVEAEPNGPTYNFEINGTYWYAPQLGVYVRAHEVISSVADPEIGGTYDKTLKSTNVPLGTVEARP